MSKNKKIIILVILGILASVYVGVAIFFTKHFLPGTVLNGYDVSYKTIAEVKENFINEASTYRLEIVGREDVVDYISATDVDLELSFDDSMNDLITMGSAFSWPISFLYTREYTTNNIAEYSEEKLENIIENLAFFDEENIIAPEDAEVVFDDDKAMYVIKEEVQGTTLNEDTFLEKIKNAIGMMVESIDLDENNCYKEPTITSDNENLVTLLNNLNKYAAAKITYTFGDDTVVVDGSVIKDFIVLDGLETSLDEDLVREYVNSLARTYDTFGTTRTFTTHTGETISVSGGDYGWWMDRSSTTTDLIEAIEGSVQTNLTPVYYATAASYGENDYGDTYVEIDLDSQHVYVYTDGELVCDSDCVSGKVTEDRYTPDGTYSITYKETDATLVGENYSSAVSYWMPFNGNIGMHDASWRSVFGSDIYVNSGSHGCVNLPVDKAKEIFENVEKGEAVIVYGGIKPDELSEYLKSKNSTQTDEATTTDTTSTDTESVIDGATTADTSENAAASSEAGTTTDTQTDASSSDSSSAE